MTTYIESNGNVQGSGVEKDERSPETITLGRYLHNAEEQFFDTIEQASPIDGKDPAMPNKPTTKGECSEGQGLPVFSTLKKLLGFGNPTASQVPQTSNKDLMDKPADNSPPKRKATSDPAEAEEEVQEPSGSPEKNASPSRKRKFSRRKPALGSSTIKQERQEPSPTREMPISMMTGPSEPIASDESRVAEFMDQKETPKGLEILVRWEDYPEETDWTWETEESLSESVPEMVAEWKAVHPKTDVIIGKVEKILGKKKVKGTPHYLVKWEGYPAVEDRTWEPCENLHDDVPEIVEAYEKRQRKKH